MTELEKQVNSYYVKRYSEKSEQCKYYEREAAIYKDMYKEKCNEVERLELIVDLLFKRLENKA